ncbi:MAG: phosphatase PAP2 family protein [Ilumatobacter sp.]|nr:phosphatase PAP2 family protein [Ilumatobacter sp.]
MRDPFHRPTPTREGHRDASDPHRRRWSRELAITIVGALVYFGLRVVVEGDRATAVANAERLLRIERWLGVDIEQTVQTWVLGNGVVRELGNLSYVWLHWPLLIAVLVTLFLRDHRRFVHLRRAMFISGTVGLALFALVPTAPPRFMPGFVGTVGDDARRHYLTYPLSWTNQVAALPSFHAGWTLIACLALAAVLGRGAARAAVLVPAVLVVLSVVTTGNHYVLDTVLGTAIAVGAYVLTDPDRRARKRRPESSI